MSEEELRGAEESTKFEPSHTQIPQTMRVIIVLCSLIPALAMLIVWGVGSLMHFDGQGAILLLPFVLLVWCAPVVLFLGILGWLVVRDRIFGLATLLGALQSGALWYAVTYLT